MEKFSINIANDYSEILGGRWIKLGPYSGEDFYNLILKPKFEEALNVKEKLHVYLDGTKGYGSSFLDQSFGELARIHGVSKVKDIIEFHTHYFKWYVDYIKNEIWEKK